MEREEVRHGVHHHVAAWGSYQPYRAALVIRCRIVNTARFTGRAPSRRLPPSQSPHGSINSCILLTGILMSLSGCGGPKYVPDITLSPQGPTIDATAELHDLNPAPALLSGSESFGLTAPDVKAVEASDLAAQVEKELQEALQSAGVFARVERFDPKPDVVLAGRINALHEHYRPQIWSYVPGADTIARLLNMKSYLSSGEADLTLFVLKPTGEILGRYSGKSSFRDSFNPTKEVPPGARLNRALSEAVQEIQKQLIEDAELRKVAAK